MSEKKKVLVSATNARGFVRQALTVSTSPAFCARVIVVSSVVEAYYAAYVWVVAGTLALCSVPTIRGFYGISIDQATATVIVPIGIAYIAVKVIADMTPEPKPESAVSLRGRVMTVISVPMVLGIAAAILSIAIAVSMPIYRLVHITWVSGVNIAAAASACFVAAAVMIGISGALLETVAKFRQSRGEYPTVEQLFWAVLVKVDADVHQHRRLAA